MLAACGAVGLLPCMHKDPWVVSTFPLGIATGLTIDSSKRLSEAKLHKQVIKYNLVSPVLPHGILSLYAHIILT